MEIVDFVNNRAFQSYPAVNESLLLIAELIHRCFAGNPYDFSSGENRRL
jgi:hypothetical protein